MLQTQMPKWWYVSTSCLHEFFGMVGLINGWIDRWMDHRMDQLVWTDKWMDGCTGEWKDPKIDGLGEWLSGWMDG